MEKVANLAIEFWTSLFEVEIKQNKKHTNPNFTSIIIPNQQNIINLLLQGLATIDAEKEEENLTDDDS